MSDRILKNHGVSWRHDGSFIVGKITCSEPETAFCHQCDECCTHGSDEGPSHVECLVADDIVRVGAIMVYCGDSTTVKNGPIEIGWDGSDWVWWYEGDSHAKLGPDERDIAVEDAITDLSVVGETVGP